MRDPALALRATPTAMLLLSGMATFDNCGHFHKVEGMKIIVPAADGYETAEVGHDDVSLLVNTESHEIVAMTEPRIYLVRRAIILNRNPATLGLEMSLPNNIRIMADTPPTPVDGFDASMQVEVARELFEDPTLPIIDGYALTMSDMHFNMPLLEGQDRKQQMKNDAAARHYDTEQSRNVIGPDAPYIEVDFVTIEGPVVQMLGSGIGMAAQVSEKISVYVNAGEGHGAYRINAAPDFVPGDISEWTGGAATDIDTIVDFERACMVHTNGESREIDGETLDNVVMSTGEFRLFIRKDAKITIARRWAPAATELKGYGDSILGCDIPETGDEADSVTKGD